MLDKDTDDLLDWPCEKWRSISESQRGNEYRLCQTTKEGWLDWSHLAQELPSETRYCIQESRKKRRRKKDEGTGIWKRQYDATILEEFTDLSQDGLRNL